MWIGLKVISHVRVWAAASSFHRGNKRVGKCLDSFLINLMIRERNAVVKKKRQKTSAFCAFLQDGALKPAWNGPLARSAAAGAGQERLFPM